jgi:hypothetical protein
MNRGINVEWQCVPTRFHYFRDAVEACGETRIVKYSERLGRHIGFAEKVTKKQLAQLVPVYERILAQGDLEALWDWLEKAEKGSESEKSAAWYVRGILMVLSDLAERGVSPFARERITSCRPTPPIQRIGVLAHLPEELSYLVEPALKYGRYQFDNEIFDFLEHATSEEMEELATIAERVLLNDHYLQVNRFLDRYDMTGYPEAARLYFLFGVLCYADLPFDRAPED